MKRIDQLTPNQARRAKQIFIELAEPYQRQIISITAQMPIQEIKHADGTIESDPQGAWPAWAKATVSILQQIIEGQLQRAIEEAIKTA